MIGSMKDLNIDTYQKFYVEYEDRARNKKLGSDANASDAVDIGAIASSDSGVDQGQSDQGNGGWDVPGWIDEEGYWWLHDGNWSGTWSGSGEGHGDIDAVNKAKTRMVVARALEAAMRIIGVSGGVAGARRHPPRFPRVPPRCRPLGPSSHRRLLWPLPTPRPHPARPCCSHPR